MALDKDSLAEELLKRFHAQFAENQENELGSGLAMQHSTQTTLGKYATSLPTVLGLGRLNFGCRGLWLERILSPTRQDR